MSGVTLADLTVEDRRVLGYDHPLLNQHAEAVEKQLGLPPNMLRALKDAGENYGVKAGISRAFTTSPKGAQGVMQFMPKTAERVGLSDPSDPYEAIQKAGEYVSKYIIPTIGSTDPSLIAAAYNAGENRSSLKEGKIPEIPETQKYAARVAEFLAVQPKASQASRSAPALRLEDLLPEDAAIAAKTSGSNPTEGMSRTDRVLAGAGKSMVDLASGSRQLLADAVVNPISRAVTGKNLMSDGRAEEAERRRLDAALMRDPWGVGGYIGGSALTTVLPGAAVARAAPVAATASALGRALPGLAGSAAKISVPAAAVGATFGALAPVAAEGERGANAAFGAAVGPLAALAGAGAGKGLSYLARELPEVAGALERIVPKALVGRSWNASAAPSERAAVRAAIDADIPVYGSQLRNPGKVLPGSRGAAQSEALDRAVAKTFGQSTDDLVAAFQNAPKDIGTKYQQVLANKVIPLGKDHVDDLLEVSKFNAARSPRFAPDRELQDAVERAVAAAKSGAPLSGEDYQAALREYSSAMTHALKGTELKPSNPRLAQGYEKLIGALNTQAAKVMTPAERQLFKTANKEWRNMTMLSSLAPRDAAGNIDPSKLANLLARKDKSAFVQGKGDQTLADLARFGNTYMGLDKRAPRGVVQQAKETMKQAAPFMLATTGEAALIGSQLDHGGNPEEGLLGKMAPYGVGLGAALLLNKGLRSGMDPRLHAADLARPRGALPLAYGNGAGLAGSAGLTGAALLPPEPD
jgi:hypothetical protein